MKKNLLLISSLFITSFIVAQPCVAISGFSITSPSCFGLTNGSVIVTYSAGAAPYNIDLIGSTSQSFTTSALSQNISGISADSYNIIITDNNGCQAAQQINVSEPMALIMTASSFSNVSCFGGNNGQISTTVQGGTPVYTYSWSPIQAGNIGLISGLSAGGYSLIIVDANNCSINANFNITEPSFLTTTYTSFPTTCGFANGSATLSIGGGTPNYSIVWNLPGSPTGTIVTGVPPGSWIADVTDSRGCVIQQTVGILNSPAPSITSFNVTPPSCNGLSNGILTVNYSAGVAPYTVVWSSPISQTITTTALTQSVSGISSGVYTATLTDNNGCITSQPVNVNQPGLLALSTIPNPTICYGQSTQIAASGQSGTPPYTYSWSPNPFVGGGPHSVNPTNTASYTVALSDANGCAPSPKVITVNVMPQLLITGSAISICDGDAVLLTPMIVSPGIGGPYNYSWSTSANTSSITVIGNAPTVATTNTYVVIIDDGCSPTASATFTVNASICTGIHELNNSFMSIYPNPTNDLITIESQEALQKLELTTIAGHLILSEKVISHIYKLSLQDETKGIYFLKIFYANGKCVTKKIIKL